ncbi:hypothetical protein QE152_g33261 [Popillia japonica]|uniref:Uncharacterized protein n=1 Tax=Popillia japonica TaxID=7064 RepID=A0AAW1IXT3_POPJA
MVTIHVLDVDATTTQTEVEEVIQTAVNSQLITVKSLRPSWDGNQIATVQASDSGSGSEVSDSGSGSEVSDSGSGSEASDSGSGSEVSDNGSGSDVLDNESGSKDSDIRIVLDPDIRILILSDICSTSIKYHKPGHKARGRNGQPYCPSCKSDDHRPDTTKCPNFRELIKKQRKETGKGNNMNEGAKHKQNVEPRGGSNDGDAGRND